MAVVFVLLFGKMVKSINTEIEQEEGMSFICPVVE